jgi:hypothetical protein
MTLRLARPGRQERAKGVLVPVTSDEIGLAEAFSADEENFDTLVDPTPREVGCSRVA